MDLIIIQKLGVAIVLGFLIGLEREHVGRKDIETHFGGVRTFTLIAILGALAQIYSEWVFLSAVIGAGVVGAILISYWISSRQKTGMGMTSEVAAVMVFVLGFLSGLGEYVMATALGLVVLTLLHFKKPLHQLAGELKEADVVAAIKFILIAFIILPLLPDQSFGPYDFFNPYTVWLMVVLISGISYLSYIGIKFLGANRGIGLTGFLAGFISSTALVLSFSADSKKNKKIVFPYVVAVVVASSAMFFRILVEVAVVSPQLLESLSLPMGVMGGTGMVSSLYFWFRRKKRKSKSKMDSGVDEISSPFSLEPAFKFGLFFVAVLFFASWAQDVFGNRGLYVTSVVSGLMDVDAITVSMANLFNSGGVQESAAVTAITIAAVTNTVVKGGMFLLLGARSVAWRVNMVFLLMIGAGLASVLLVNNF